MAKKKAKKHHSKKHKAAKSNKRPVAFLKKMAAKMEKNLPKLKAIIKARGG